MTADYPQEYSIFLVSTLTNDAQLPDRVYGKHGTLDLEGSPTLKFNGDFRPELQEKSDGKDEAKFAVKPRRDMVGNFLDAVRGTDRLHYNVALGTATMVAIKLAVEACRQMKTMDWDPKAERVVG